MKQRWAAQDAAITRQQERDRKADAYDQLERDLAAALEAVRDTDEKNHDLHHWREKHSAIIALARGEK